TTTTTTTTVAQAYTPIPGPAQDFLILGDWGTEAAAQISVAQEVNNWAAITQPNAIISVGDNFYNGNQTYDGIQSANDIKFTEAWKNMYSGQNIANVPWWTVLGNHDWYTINSQVYELTFKDSRWILPDFFYTNRVQVDTGVYATFIFIETDLLAYGFAGKTAEMNQNFINMGWTSDQNTNKKQLAWIENTIAQYNNDQYIIIVGHHPTYTCVTDVTADLAAVQGFINKWGVSAYVNGHSHSMAGYVTNSGKTLVCHAFM
ncbi:Metallo-dependent phosphatase, partial [Rhizoclosmatium globosum]